MPKRLISMRLSTEMLARLQAVASITGESQSNLVEAALKPFLDDLTKKRGIDKLVKQLIKTRGKS